MNQSVAHDPANTSETRVTVTLPPIDCAPWCEDGNGHINANHPDDQYCIAGSREQELERKPEQIVPGGVFYRRTIDTSLQKDPFSEPFVTIHAECAELTLDDAEAHAHRVLELVAMARGEAKA